MLVVKLQPTLKRIAFLLLTSAALWAAFFGVALAERINLFDVHIQLEPDGSFTVTEKIEYNFGDLSRHGIYRNIYDRHPQDATSWYKNRYIKIDLISVQRNGNAEIYSIRNEDGLSVKIGNPDTTIKGHHLYEIVYRVDGAISEYDNQTELYWNVTGDEWVTSISNVNVTLQAIAPAKLLSALECYQGQFGTPESCTSKTLVNDRQSKFTTDNLASGEGLTIGQAISLPVAPKVFETYNTTLFNLVIILVWFLGLGFWLYRWEFQHRTSKVVIAQYEPYKEFKPMFTGVLLDNRLDSCDITAGIIYLAEQGFLSIRQIKEKALGIFNTTDYELTLLRHENELDSKALAGILNLLFRYGGEVGRVIKLSEVTKSPSQRRSNALKVQEIKKFTEQDMVDLGFIEQRTTRGVKTAILSGVAFILFFIIFTIDSMLDIFEVNTVLWIIAVVTSFIIVLSVGLERRTKKGFEALYYLKGFKDFLSTTEKERYKFHNAPNLSPQKFMEFLPYAIAFKVEKEWGEVFKDVNIIQPDWYSSDVSGSHFYAADFVSEITGFSTAIVNSTTQPSSSGSGSGGRGFSGGGGGGGGGGSW